MGSFKRLIGAMTKYHDGASERSHFHICHHRCHKQQITGDDGTFSYPDLFAVHTVQLFHRPPLLILAAPLESIGTIGNVASNNTTQRLTRRELGLSSTETHHTSFASRNATKVFPIEYTAKLVSLAHHVAFSNRNWRRRVAVHCQKVGRWWEGRLSGKIVCHSGFAWLCSQILLLDGGFLSTMGTSFAKGIRKRQFVVGCYRLHSNQ